ncbi:hypothetical protein P9112_010472 [Eukaryota sp. TZLM1-RC]
MRPYLSRNVSLAKQKSHIPRLLLPEDIGKLTPAQQLELYGRIGFESSSSSSPSLSSTDSTYTRDRFAPVMHRENLPRLAKFYSTTFNQWLSILNNCKCSLFIDSNIFIDKELKAFCSFIRSKGISCDYMDPIIVKNSKNNIFNHLLSKLLSKSNAPKTLKKVSNFNSDFFLKAKKYFKPLLPYIITITNLNDDCFRSLLTPLSYLVSICNFSLVFSLTDRTGLRTLNASQLYFLNPRRIRFTPSIHREEKEERRMEGKVEEMPRHDTSFAGFDNVVHVDEHLNFHSRKVFRSVLSLSLSSEMPRHDTSPQLFVTWEKLGKSKELRQYSSSLQDKLNEYFRHGILEEKDVVGRGRGVVIKMKREEVERFLKDVEI